MWKSLMAGIEEYLKRKNVQHALLEARVVQKWPEVIARRYPEMSPPTKASRVQNNILYVWVSEPLWIAELEKRSDSFLQTMKAETGFPLKKIVFFYRHFSQNLNESRSKGTR